MKRVRRSSKSARRKRVSVHVREVEELPRAWGFFIVFLLAFSALALLFVLVPMVIDGVRWFLVEKVQLSPEQEALVGQWAFDNGNANDYSGNGYNGVVHGATYFADGGYDMAGAYSFARADNYISIANAPNLGLPNFTVFARIKAAPSVAGSANNIIVKQLNATNRNYLLYIGSAGKLVGSSSIGGVQSDVGSGVTVDDNIWHYVAYSYDGATQKIYVDGVLTNSVQINGSADTQNSNLTFSNPGETTDRRLDDFSCKFCQGVNANTAIAHGAVRFENGVMQTKVWFTDATDTDHHCNSITTGWVNGSMASVDYVIPGHENELECYAVLKASWTEANLTGGGYEPSTCNVSSTCNINSALSAGLYFNGTLDDVRIYNRALSDNEIAGFMQTINFIAPTYPDLTNLAAKDSAPIKASIVTPSLDDLKFSWAGANYSLYDSSLKLMLNFDNVSAIGESATKVVDVSKSRLNGTVSGATWMPHTQINQSGIPVMLFIYLVSMGGKYGGAYHFDGGDYINFGDVLDMGTSPFTVSAWAKWDNKTTYQSILNKGNSEGGAGFRFMVDPNDKIYAHISDGTHSALVRTDQSFLPNRWHHVLMTDNGDVLNVYVDGVLINRTNSAEVGSLNNSNLLQIGRQYSGTQYYLFGEIDEPRIWDRAVSAAEVKQLYSLNLNKYDSTKWQLSVNESDLAEGRYSYSVSAKDAGVLNGSTGTRVVIVGQLCNGNSACDIGENCSNCASDCGACPVPACGNNTCDAVIGENCSTCTADCGPCPICNNNQTCDAGETCSSCPADCGNCTIPACNNNSVCDLGENCSNCAVDCGNCAAACIGEGAYTLGSNASQCCAGLSGFAKPGLAANGSLICYNATKGTPVCMNPNLTTEGWYYWKTSASLLRNENCSQISGIPICGNYVCELGKGENLSSCAIDCFSIDRAGENCTIKLNGAARVKFPCSGRTNDEITQTVMLGLQISGALGWTVIEGLDLNESETKTLYVSRLSSTSSIGYVCLKDQKFILPQGISVGCNRTNETLMQCPGILGNYNCTLANSRHTFVISGLKHSGAQEYIPAGCGDDRCNSTIGENCSTCEDDCGRCSSVNVSVCGDGACDDDEDCSSCSDDCGNCGGGTTCYTNWTCSEWSVCSVYGIHTRTCIKTNAACVTVAAKPAESENCQPTILCGDGRCDGTESCSSCSDDCGACVVCGDGQCDYGETCTNCALDCGECAKKKPDMLFIVLLCVMIAALVTAVIIVLYILLHKKPMATDSGAAESKNMGPPKSMGFAPVAPRAPANVAPRAPANVPVPRPSGTPSSGTVLKK